jgi:hypothetical protein
MKLSYSIHYSDVNMYSTCSSHMDVVITWFLRLCIETKKKLIKNNVMIINRMLFLPLR